MVPAALFYVQYDPEEYHYGKAQEEDKIFKAEHTLCKEKEAALHREPGHNGIKVRIALYQLCTAKLIEEEEAFHNDLSDYRGYYGIALHRREKHTECYADKSP